MTTFHVDTFHVAIGDNVSFTKTVSESDVYLFADITGDLAPNHGDETGPSPLGSTDEMRGR